MFGLAAAGWIFAATQARAWGITTDVDCVVALTAVVMLVAGGAIERPQLEWRIHWGTLLLFGGGLALASAAFGRTCGARGRRTRRSCP